MFDIINQFKAGIKTSEFWLGLVAVLYNAFLGFYATVDKDNIDWKQVATGAAMAFGAAIYAYVRTWLKTHRTALVGQVATAVVEQSPAGTPVGFAPQGQPVIGAPPVG